MKQKLLSILALLMMAVTGAWADTVVLGSPNSNTATLSDENGIITLSDPSNFNSSIQLGSSAYKISYGDTEYKPMKLSSSPEFTLSFKAGVTINKVTLMAMSADSREGTVGVGGGDGDKSSLGTLPSRNTNGNYLTVDITNNTGLKFSTTALAIIVVEYSTTSTVAVTLDKTEASMIVGGDALTLTATVAPDDATDKTVTWTTSDATVATVADGVVTAVGAGTATITATATNGTVDTSDDKTATCAVTVTAPTTYIVAGNNAEIFGSIWDGTYEANKMTKGDDGKYTKTYNVEDAFSDIQLKVVKDGQDWIGDETGFNVTFSMKQAGSFTVTLDPNANPVYVTVTGDNVVFANTEYAINYATGMQNGTVTGPDTAKEDDEVTLTITPAAGYVLESISVTGVTTENAVEVTDGKFIMPAEDVNVIATFKSVTYSITVKEGTEDAGNWTVSPNPAEAGQTVTISYTGTKKVKSIKAVKKAVAPAGTDLSTISADYEAKDGETLTGTLGSNVKISIADGATVALKDVTINGVNETSYEWAGITCAGDATITLEGTNTVKGFHLFYPGIYVPEGKTLTIEGEGSLNASSNGPSTGIGGGFYMHCGDIVINGGNITATGGNFNAGIGGGGVNFGDVGTVIRCGKITINGGTVTATGGESATGIGCGYNGASNDITITGGTVTATGGEYAAGIGSGEGGSCGAITISGGTVTATAVKWAAGIGGGNNNGASGTITITSGVTQVTATKGSNCLNSIGSGDGGENITVIIEDFDKVIQN